MFTPIHLCTTFYLELAIETYKSFLSFVVISLFTILTAPSFLKIHFVADSHQDDNQSGVAEWVVLQLLTKMKSERFPTLYFL